jgi:hypothetical protein
MEICPVHNITRTEDGVCSQCPEPLSGPAEVRTEPDPVPNEGPQEPTSPGPAENPNNGAAPGDDDKNKPPNAGAGDGPGPEDEADPVIDNERTTPLNGTQSNIQLEQEVRKAFKDSSRNEIKGRKSKYKGNTILQGNIISVERAAEERSASKQSAFERSEPTRVDNCGELDKEYSSLVSSLRKERVLILGKSGDGQAQIVSRQIAKSLKIKNKEYIRFFSLSHRPPDDQKSLNIHSFSFERDPAEGKRELAVIIIDAIEKWGEAFADSLLTKESPFTILPDKLEQNALFLICVLETKKVEDWKTKPGQNIFPCRVIRKKESPESKPENDIDLEAAEALLRNRDDIEAPIIRTILFVASFFPNLSSADFSELVGKFLKTEPDVIKTEPAGENGETLSKTVSLINLWNLKAHIFTERCLLARTTSEQGYRVGFENPAHTAYFRERFESRFFVFLDRKLFQILDFGLIFHPSDAVSANCINFMVDYIPEVGERYTEWVIEIFRFLEKVENDLSVLKARFKIEELGNKRFCYERLADLFRAMSGEVLEKVGWEIMNRLVRGRCFRSALILIKKLEFAPNLDASYWLKQLYERGDSEIKDEALEYVFDSVIGTSVPRMIDRVKVWLSEETTAAGNYSDSTNAALNLILDYYSYQLLVFDEQFYGLEPSQFGLFRFDSDSSPETQLDLIVKYLMHPAFFLSNKYIHTIKIAFFLAEWAEILCLSPGSRDSVSDPPSEPDAEPPDESHVLGNEEILDRLLEQTCANSNKEQQEGILYVWGEYMEDLTAYIDDPSTLRKSLENAVGRRRTIRNLIERFKKCRRSLK